MQEIPLHLRTIPDIIAFHATERPEAPAIGDPNSATLSFAQVQEKMETLANGLPQLKPSGQERWGIVLPNGSDISVVLLAVTGIGVAVPFNPAQTRPEFESQFKATRIDGVILQDEQQGAAAEAARALDLPIVRLTARCNLIAAHPGRVARTTASPEDTALVLMTSGSTGRPKIVPLSHRNLCRSAFDVAKSLDITGDDVCLVMWEQFHIGGLVDLLLAPLAAGSSIVAAGSFDAARFFDLQKDCKASWFQGVPTSLGALLHHAKRHRIAGPLPRLRFLRSVAAALPPSLQAELVDHFKVPVVRTLGMTEASPLITTTPVAIAGDKPGSVGKSAGPEVVILSGEGERVPPGVTGEVAIRGENVFQGYEDNPEANALAFRDGWFLTGDLGQLDEDGDLFLTGRAKEMINRGGEKIFPKEVEEALMTHPDVRDVACFALAHATLGEDIACAVESDREITAHELRAFLSTRVAAHKIPGQMLFLPSLPRNPVGKVDRAALVTAMAERSARADTDVALLTPMQDLVTTIWKDELSLVEVGLDEDFASVDGDSLSAVRILVELENRFGRAVPDEIVARFATIRDLAEGLEAHGFDATGTRNEASVRKTVTENVLAERFRFSGDSNDAQRLIAEASGRADLRLKLDHIIAHLPPADVAHIASELEGTTPGAACGEIGVLQRMRMKREFAAALAEIRRYLPDAANINRWTREDVADGAMLFSDATVPTVEKDLIVGFSGNRMRLLMPGFRFLREISPEDCDVLLLVDHTRALFRNGIASIGTDVPAIASFLSQFCASRGYDRLLGIGTSGGSLAVLQAGIAAGFDAIACVAPASLEKHKEWSDAFENMTAQHDPDQQSIRIIHGRRARNRDCADAIQRYLPHAQCIRYPHASKNIFHDAQVRGALRPLLQTWLA